MHNALVNGIDGRIARLNELRAQIGGAVTESRALLVQSEQAQQYVQSLRARCTQAGLPQPEQWLKLPAARVGTVGQSNGGLLPLDTVVHLVEERVAATRQVHAGATQSRAASSQQQRASFGAAAAGTGAAEARAASVENARLQQELLTLRAKNEGKDKRIQHLETMFRGEGKGHLL